MRTEEEVQKMLDEASDASSKETKFGGMTYEEGVLTALEWVLENPDITNPVKGD